MRHRDARQRLKQKPAHARMLKRNLVTSLLLYENVRTTRARAKAIQPVIDRLISQAKKKTPHTAIRLINSYVTDKNACRKIMEVYTKRYANRPSGLTRMKPAGARQGDGAKLVDLSFVEGEEVVVEKEVKEAKPKKNEKPVRQAQGKKETAKKTTKKASSSKETK